MKLIVHTAQMAKRKSVIGFTDITVKSGEKCFAPSWNLLMSYKDGVIDEVEYTRQYLDLMRKSYIHNRAVWDALISKSEVTLCCYCAAGSFCHRLILKDILHKICQKRGVEFIDAGEVV